MTIAAPSWVKLAAEKRVFWQPRTLMIEVMTTCARQQINALKRNDILDWAISVSVNEFAFVIMIYVDILFKAGIFNGR